jgi:P63C domain
MSNEDNMNKIVKKAGDDYLLEAIHGSADHPLKIGNLEIPCYVLEDGKRVLVQNGMLTALDMAQGTAGRGEGNRLVKFMNTKAMLGFASDQLRASILNPIRFKTPAGQETVGYEATILADICDAVLEARKAEKLNYQQVHIADQCEILMRGFARVGIIALVDEATGYQDYRDRQALERILERFLQDELAKWAKRFPDTFYKELFRLRGWDYKPDSVKRPKLVGTLTNDLIYSRLAPGVLDELKRRTPRDDQGRAKVHYHRWLTDDLGVPRLQEHLSAVIALMRASQDWRTFMRMMNRALPKWEGNYELELYDKDGLPI